MGKNRRTIGEQHRATATLVSILQDYADRFFAGNTDGPLLYSQLNLAITMDVQQEARGYLYSARQYVRREQKIVFEAMAGVGLVIAVGAGKINVAEVQLKKSRNASKRATEYFQTVQPAEYAKFNDEEKRRWNTGQAQAGLIQLCTSAGSRKRLEEAVQSNGEVKEIAISEALNTLKGQRNA